MYKLIIIDDDFRSAQVMSEFVDYNSLNFKVEGVFRSAEDALEFLSHNEIDIVLSDIKMKGISGLELLRIINEKYPGIKVILISAYRDFAYAKEAISNNAFDYVTKPVSYPEFVNVLTKVRDSIGKVENVRISNLDEAIGLYGKISDYFNDVADVKEIEDCFKNYQENIDISKCQCVIMNVTINNLADFLAENWKYGSEELFNALRQIVPINMNDIVFSFMSEAYNDMRIIAVNLGSEADFKERIDNVISHIVYEMYFILKLSVNIEPQSVENSIINLKNKQKKDVGVAKVVDVLFRSSYSNEKEKTDSILDDFFITSKPDEQNELCKQLTLRLKNREEDEESIFLDDFCIDCIKSQQVLKDYCSILLKQSVSMPCFANSKIKLLFKAIQYVNNNYFKDISLDAISEYVMLSSSYFSHYFKQKMGESYSDFIIKVRMEKAKMILSQSPDIPIKKLVTLVGYKSQSYFYNTFREYTGWLPSDFKNKD